MAQVLPIEDRPTVLELFRSERNIGVTVITFMNKVKFSPAGLKKAWNEYQWDKLLLSQVYLPQRAEAVGAEIAAAHFVCFRGGKIRFYGQSDWTVKDPEDNEMSHLPRFFDPSYKMEALDCSKMTLVYEGLQNIRMYIYLTFNIQNTFNDS